MWQAECQAAGYEGTDASYLSAAPVLPLSNSKLQISISCVSGGKVAQAELWNHAPPQSL